MTMLSFRVNDADAAAIDLWADRLHIDRSELLRDALRRRLSELTADHDARAYTTQPITVEEKSLAEVADWGPAEDWSDWTESAEVNSGETPARLHQACHILRTATGC